MVHGAVRRRGCSLGSSRCLLCGSGALAGQEVPVGGAARNEGTGMSETCPQLPLCVCRQQQQVAFKLEWRLHQFLSCQVGTVFAVKDNAVAMAG